MNARGEPRVVDVLAGAEQDTILEMPRPTFHPAETALHILPHALSPFAPAVLLLVLLSFYRRYQKWNLMHKEPDEKNK